MSNETLTDEVVKSILSVLLKNLKKEDGTESDMNGLEAVTYTLLSCILDKNTKQETKIAFCKQLIELIKNTIERSDEKNI